MDLIIQLIEAQGEIFYFVGGFLALLAVLGSLNMMPRNTAASLMISTGIGGTFLGILIALTPLDFAPENINDSIESLLTGMKTAFVTSLLGIGSAIISRFLWGILPKAAKSSSPEYKDLSGKLDEIKNAIAGDGDSSLTSQISKLRNDNRDGFRELKEQLNKLDEVKNAIAGDGDSSLANQFSKLRNDNQDGFRELKEQLDAVKNAIAGEGDSSMVNQLGKLREENRDGLEKLDAKMAGLADTIKDELVAKLDGINRAIAGEDDSSLVNQVRGSRDENREGLAKLDTKMEGMTDAIKVDLVAKLDGINRAIAGEEDSSLVNQIGVLHNGNQDGFGKLDAKLNELAEIKNAIAGEGDSNLSHQIRALRDGNQEGFEKMGGKLEGLADTIKGELVSSLENLVEEIRKVIVDQLSASLKELIDKIEKALIEQFGKTFVEFNESVQAIKKWQEEHKQHVEQLTAAFQKAAEHLQEIEAGVRKTEETTAKTMESFMALVHNTQEQMLKAGQQMDVLEKQVRTFADMQDKANQAIPEIQKALDEIKKAPDEINNAIEGIVTHWGERMIPVAEEFAETIRRHRG